MVILLSQTIGEHEQRAVIDPQSINDPEVVKLQRILIDWINDELAEQRIIVQQLDEDMYDGQVLHKLWEKLTGKKLDVPEVTQSEQGQHEKLNIVLKAVNHVSFTQQLMANESFYNCLSPRTDTWLPSEDPTLVGGQCALEKYCGNSAFIGRSGASLPCPCPAAGECLCHRGHC